jgi:hypothetical protein
MVLKINERISVSLFVFGFSVVETTKQFPVQVFVPFGISPESAKDEKAKIKVKVKESFFIWLTPKDKVLTDDIKDGLEN